jgi:hypothetical protein
MKIREAVLKLLHAAVNGEDSKYISATCRYKRANTETK